MQRLGPALEQSELFRGADVRNVEPPRSFGGREVCARELANRRDRTGQLSSLVGVLYLDTADNARSVLAIDQRTKDSYFPRTTDEVLAAQQLGGLLEELAEGDSAVICAVDEPSPLDCLGSVQLGNVVIHIGLLAFPEAGPAENIDITHLLEDYRAVITAIASS